jgi:hypothetical protein
MWKAEHAAANDFAFITKWNPLRQRHFCFIVLQGSSLEWRALAPKLGLHLIFGDVHSANQFESAFAAMMQKRPDALSVTT